MDDNVILTIVTVNYNNLEGLRRTLASVAKQTMPTDIEHLIADGGSSDGSAEFVHEYTTRHAWARGWSRADDGIYDAMNQAIESSTGRYIYFLNSGDEFYDDKAVDRMRHALATSRSVWAVGNVLHRNGGTQDSIVHGAPFSRFRFLMGTQQYNHQGVIFDRSILLATGGFGTNPPYYADAVVMLKFASIERPTEIPVLLAIYEGGGYSADKVASMPLSFHRIRVERDEYPRILELLSFAWAASQVIRRQGLRKGLKLTQEFTGSRASRQA